MIKNKKVPIEWSFRIASLKQDDFFITTIYRSYETADNYFSAAVKHDMANPKF